MGDDSVILQGQDALDPDDRRRQEDALFSTVHGAGRVMGRMEAAGKWKKGRMVRPGKINHDEMEAWLDEKGVVLRGGDLDEAPPGVPTTPRRTRGSGRHDRGASHPTPFDRVHGSVPDAGGRLLGRC